MICVSSHALVLGEKNALLQQLPRSRTPLREEGFLFRQVLQVKKQKREVWGVFASVVAINAMDETFVLLLYLGGIAVL